MSTENVQGMRHVVLPDGTHARAVALFGEDGVGLGSAGNPLAIETSGADIASSYGDLAVSDRTPLFSVFPTNGLPSGVHVQSTVGGSGTISGEPGKILVSTGTSVGGFGALRSKRVARYRPGTELVFSAAAMFDAPVANSVQILGPQTAEDGLAIGYNGTTLSVFHKHGGVRSVQRFSVTAGSGGGEDITITLAGVATTVSAVPALAPGPLASYLQQAVDWTGVGGGWRVSAATRGDDSVDLTFVAFSAGASAGAFSFASDGDAVASYAEITPGETGTDTWIPRTSWTDPLDGTGESGVDVDFSQVQNYLFLLNGTTAGVYVVAEGRPVLAHRLTATDEPLFVNPTMPLQIVSYSAGSTTDVTLECYGFSASLKGPLRRIGARRGVTNFLANVTNTTVVPLLSITTQADRNGRAFNAPVFVPRVHATGDGNRAAFVRVLLNAELTNHNWQTINTQGSTLFDVSATAVSGGIPLDATVVPRNGFVEIDLRNIDVELYQGDVLTLAVGSVTGAADVAGTIQYIEDR